MIEESLLEMLRCPADPSRQARLIADDIYLRCSRCEARFRVRDGIPILTLNEVILPSGCSRTADLECQRRPGSK
jgi:uncharacterized protein YbaR (Trm112 family)